MYVCCMRAMFRGKEMRLWFEGIIKRREPFGGSEVGPEHA